MFCLLFHFIHFTIWILIYLVINYCSLYQQQLAHQQALFQQFQSQAQGGYFGAGANGNNGGAYAPNFASSSGGFGPGGVQQTASIIPANPVIIASKTDLYHPY